MSRRPHRPWLGDEPLRKTISGFRITEKDHAFCVTQAAILECTLPEYVRRLIETERKIHERRQAVNNSTAPARIIRTGTD